ncbi:hypothetical protein C0992_012262, partial [Termitomyces sp. T32_za158]
ASAMACGLGFSVRSSTGSLQASSASSVQQALAASHQAHLLRSSPTCSCLHASH